MHFCPKPKSFPAYRTAVRVKRSLNEARRSESSLVDSAVASYPNEPNPKSLPSGPFMVSPAALAEEGMHSESVGNLSQRPSIRLKKGKYVAGLEECCCQGHTPYVPTYPRCRAAKLFLSASSIDKLAI